MNSLLSATVIGDDYLTVKTSAYSDAVRYQFKAVPGNYWNGTAKAWCGPREAILPVLARLQRAGVVSHDVKVPDETPFEPQGELDVAPSQSGKKPFEFQVAGSKFLLTNGQKRGAALLGDEMGLGKSGQLARALECELRTRGGSALIVAPAGVVANWIQEMRDWAPSVACIRLGEKKKKKDGGGRVLTWPDGACAFVSFDTLKSLRLDELTAARVIGIDEFHYASNPTAARTKALVAYVKRSRAAFSNVVVYGLTGTPVQDSPKDLWHPMEILYPGDETTRRPPRFGPRFSPYGFEARYAEGDYVDVGIDRPVWQAKGKSNLEELGARFQALMLRRTKRECLELPEKQRILFPVEMPQEALKRLMTGMSFDAWGADRVGRILSHVEEYKLDAAEELCKELLRNGKRPLLVTQRIESAKTLAERLACPRVDGQTPADKRVATLAGPEGSRLPAVATCGSVETGINLVMFDTMVFVGLSWLPSTLVQVEARIHRIGQMREVTYYYMIGLATADEIVKERVLQRLDMFGTVVGNAEDEGKLGHALRGGETEEELLAGICVALGKMLGEI